MESDLGIPVCGHHFRQCVLGSYGRFAWLDAANALVWLLVLCDRHAGHVLHSAVFGANMVLMCADAVVLGLGISAFVPMGAVFPALASEHKGAAISAHNLASGLTTFFGPLIATVLISTIGFGGVCWTYAICYAIGSLVTLGIHPHQPGFDDRGHRITAIERN